MNEPASSPANLLQRFAPAWADVALVFLVFAYFGAWPVPDTNEAHYLAKAKHYWQPQWIADDLFLSSANSHIGFYATFGYATQLFSLPTAAWVCRIACWLLLAIGWRRLSFSLLPRYGMAAASAACVVVLNEKFHLAGEWFVGGAEAKVPAYALVFFGLADIFQARWNRGLAVLGAAAAMHVLVGGWSLVAVGLVWLTDRARPSLWTLLPGLISAGLFAFIGVVPGLRLNAGLDPELVATGNQIYVFQRISHHLWAPEFVAKFGLRHAALYAVYAATCFAIAPDDARRRLRWFVAAAAIFSSIGLIVSYASPEPSRWAAAILKYYWFRLSDVAVAMGVTFELAALSSRQDSATFVKKLAVATMFLLIGWGAVSVWQARAVRDGVPRGERIDDAATYANWRDACEWIRDNTPRDANVLAPRAFLTFKWFSERAEYGNWKDVPQDAMYLLFWKAALDELYGTEGEYGGWINYVPRNRVLAVCHRYHVTHIVAFREPQLDLPVLYRNNSFAVYRVEFPVSGPQQDAAR